MERFAVAFGWRSEVALPVVLDDVAAHLPQAVRDLFALATRR